MTKEKLNGDIDTVEEGIKLLLLDLRMVRVAPNRAMAARKLAGVVDCLSGCVGLLSQDVKAILASLENEPTNAY